MIKLYTGDCLDIMPQLDADSIDTIITDPPYGLSFMGKDWDHGVPGIPFWQAALRVAKPGAIMLAFGGTRTFHRLTCAIEDAGWIIRDCISWIYGSGFPKSANISKLIDKAAGAERIDGAREWSGGKRSAGIMGENHGTSKRVIYDAPATPEAKTWHGYGTALKPAWEPIIVAMKPLDGSFANNALTHGVAGLWIDGGRIETDKQDPNHRHNASPVNTGNSMFGVGGHNGNLQSEGRWPANLIHDGSDEVMRGFPETVSGKMEPGQMRQASLGDGGYNGNFPDEATSTGTHGDSGSAARFFYTAKADRAEREAGLEGMGYGFTDDGRITPNDTAYQRGKTKRQNTHATVKPISLMRYLCRITKTPTGGVVLDPFMGSGSTGCAAVIEERDFIGIEMRPEFVDISARRIKHWGGPLLTTVEVMP